MSADGTPIAGNSSPPVPTRVRLPAGVELHLGKTDFPATGGTVDTPYEFYFAFK
jgi:hypothetical protein